MKYLFKVANVAGFALLILFFTSCSTPRDKDDTKPVSEEEDYDPDPPASETPDASKSEAHVVEIKQMQFVPAELRIHKGDKVTWVNHDMVEHDVTEQATKAWASSRMAVGASWSRVFTKSEDYYCNLHQVMKGKITVE